MASLVQKLRQFCRMGGFCLFVELHWKGLRAACVFIPSPVREGSPYLGITWAQSFNAMMKQVRMLVRTPT